MLPATLTLWPSPFITLARDFRLPVYAIQSMKLAVKMGFEVSHLPKTLNLCKQPQLWSVYTAPLNEGHPQSAMTSWVIVVLNSWRLKKTLVVKITSRVIQKRLVARLN